MSHDHWPYFKLNLQFKYSCSVVNSFSVKGNPMVMLLNTFIKFSTKFYACMVLKDKFIKKPLITLANTLFSSHINQSCLCIYKFLIWKASSKVLNNFTAEQYSFQYLESFGRARIIEWHMWNNRQALKSIQLLLRGSQLIKEIK